MEILVRYITGVGQTCPLSRCLFSDFTVRLMFSFLYTCKTHVELGYTVSRSCYLLVIWMNFCDPPPPFAIWKLLSKISLNVSNWTFLLNVAPCSQSIQNIAWLWLLNFFVVIWYQPVIRWIRKYFVSAVNASVIRKYAELNVQVWEKWTQGFCLQQCLKNKIGLSFVRTFVWLAISLKRPYHFIVFWFQREPDM